MTGKEIIVYVSIAISLIGNAFYFRSIWKGRTRPHAFSWIIWGLITGITFFAQLSGGAGTGAWVTGVTSVICFVGAFLAVIKGERDIKKSDFAAFIGALAAVPLWYFTQDALNAVLLSMVAEVLAFYPTIRKSWHKPREELALSYALDWLKYAMSLAAMDVYSPTTILYPIFILIIQGGFVVMLLIRRAQLGKRP